MKIAVLGAGNGGQAMAGHFSLLGFKVNLYNRNITKIREIQNTKEIRVIGEINGLASIDMVTDDIELAVRDVDLIMVTTTADAHSDIANKLAPFLRDNQIIVLNPGRTLGAIEFSHIIRKNSTKKVFIAEAQSLIYACRIEKPGEVKIIGIKDRVFFSAFPSTDTDYVIEKLNAVYNCFIKVENVLVTSLENIGAILHPAVVLLNAAAIERGNLFYFYNDMTPSVSKFISDLDRERLMVGDSFGIKLHSVSDWVSYAYGKVKGENLNEKMQNNPAYYKIQAPDKLNSRMLMEDIPTGVLPIIELGKLCNLELPLLNGVLHITQSVLSCDFRLKGRTLENIGLGNISKEELLKIL
ncbi:MAG: NADP transhydrogenase subunit alpha [Chitinophagaceae bacterium]|nr:MAG: NADP transhydrogenase subunit alpha [Chitinophagaceae bacterium]